MLTWCEPERPHGGDYDVRDIPSPRCSLKPRWPDMVGAQLNASNNPGLTVPEICTLRLRHSMNFRRGDYVMDNTSGDAAAPWVGIE